MKSILIIAIVAVAMIVLVFNVDESYGSFTPVLPVYIEDDVPTIAEFKINYETLTPEEVKKNEKVIESYLGRATRNGGENN